MGSAPVGRLGSVGSVGCVPGELGSANVIDAFPEPCPPFDPAFAPPPALTDNTGAVVVVEVVEDDVVVGAGADFGFVVGVGCFEGVVVVGPAGFWSVNCNSVEM